MEDQFGKVKYNVNVSVHAKARITPPNAAHSFFKKRSFGLDSNQEYQDDKSILQHLKND